MSMRPLLYIRYLGLPARPVPLLLIAVLAGGLALSSQAGLLGIPLALILLSWALKYAFVAFDTVARGFDELPVLSIEMVNPVDEQRPLGIILIVLVSHGITTALQPIIGEIATMTLRAAVFLSLPASIAVLGVTGRIIDAVNPKMLGGLMHRLGPDYFVLLVVIAGIVVLVGFLSSLGL
jgi:hypothetical protein